MNKFLTHILFKISASCLILKYSFKISQDKKCTRRLSLFSYFQSNWLEISSYCSVPSRFQQRKNCGIKCLWFKYLSQLDKNIKFTFKSRLDESNSLRTSRWNRAVNTYVFSATKRCCGVTAYFSKTREYIITKDVRDVAKLFG